MIVVDSSVWIDLLNAKSTPQTIKFMALLGRGRMAIPDLALTEVLQGTRSTRHFNDALSSLATIDILETTGAQIAIMAARNYRSLRALGKTVRSTIDTLIATRCILDGHELLHSDRDFDPFVEHLGLRIVAT